jgi:hypothetical protein
MVEESAHGPKFEGLNLVTAGIERERETDRQADRQTEKIS